MTITLLTGWQYEAVRERLPFLLSFTVLGLLVSADVAVFGSFKISSLQHEAFAAREVFVSTMGIIYSVGQVEDDTSSLADVMRKDHYADGRPVWTPVVAASLLVWFVLAMQCMSTVAIVRRETGGWRWPLFMIAYMNVVAYVGALIVYQVGTRLL